MTDVYSYFYTINTNENGITDEYLLNMSEMAEMDKQLDFLPKISPSRSLVKKILESSNGKDGELSPFFLFLQKNF